jgi:hypothetical protein
MSLRIIELEINEKDERERGEFTKNLEIKRRFLISVFDLQALCA